MRHGVGMEIVLAALAGWFGLNGAVVLWRLRGVGLRPRPTVLSRLETVAQPPAVTTGATR